MTQHEPDTPDGAALDFEQTADIAVYCDRPIAAQMTMIRLGLVRGSLGRSGPPALWTTVWSAADEEGRWNAVAAGSEPCPDARCRADAAVVLIDDRSAAHGVEVPQIAVNGRAAALATLDDIRLALHDIGGPAAVVAPALEDWPVPEAITGRITEMGTARRRTETLPELPDWSPSMDLAALGRQVNGDPLPASGDWCSTCGSPLTGPSEFAHGVCFDCFGIDCIREDESPDRVWHEAISRMRNGVEDVDEPAEAMSL